MRIAFTKMHGCGNDFVVIDERARPLGLSATHASALADRRTGIGCDQIIMLRPALDDGADVAMLIRNPDGSEAGACGNATRCVAALLAEQTGRRQFVIRTIAGDLPADVVALHRATVDMGPPRLDWTEVPLAREMDTLHVPLSAGTVGDPACLSMGNPHTTFFVPDLATVPVTELGPRLEHDPIFPERANVGFAQVLGPDKIRLRVWERGAGLTPACGSGACAALVNAHRRGLIGRHATLALDGGDLDIAWADNGHVFMTGPVATAFTGEIELP